MVIVRGSDGGHLSCHGLLQRRPVKKSGDMDGIADHPCHPCHHSVDRHCHCGTLCMVVQNASTVFHSLQFTRP